MYSFLVQYHWAKGEYDQAIGYGQRCVEASDHRDDVGLRVMGLYYRGASYQAQGFELALHPNTGCTFASPGNSPRWASVR
jgi:hypothetical protein